MKHGYGKHSMTNGEVYLGNFEDNLIKGKGLLFYENGDIYEGNFKDGLLNGKGSKIFDEI